MRLFLAALALLALSAPAVAEADDRAAIGRAVAPESVQPRLEPVLSSTLVINGVTTSADGRLFLPVQPQRPVTC